ncbi:alanine racemase [Knoellia sp. 3-2P3]|uniref:alanine racemase n=1 Tax=Knoellia sp. 3-2P3 TaxID=3032285 RepID=UPI0023DA7C20|nr:alanine racemase [Knoellia sp. 3-2P3]MDF2093189.1 alanine racemase [Knoellia sp. 3-2P3]
MTGSWERATAGRAAPLALVDLEAFDANAADLVRRAAGKPVRVASKSVRCRALLRRVLDRPGFRGVMAYSVREALWLAADGFTDLFVAYPSADREALEAVAANGHAAAQVTVTVDSAEHVAFLAALRRPHPLRVAVDVDASLRVGSLHLGVRRSPLRSAGQVVAVARAAQAAGLDVVGLMFYDAQVAGLPDSSPAVRLVKARSTRDLLGRRAEVVAAVRDVAGLEFVNGGGTGSLHVASRDPSLTELAAGSGLFGPTLFDGYRSFRPRPAAAFALPVVRRPAPGVVTVFGGGYIASGPPGWSRSPSVLAPRGLRLLRSEGAGEVQTPLRGRAADGLGIGDRVWFRHAKAGELCERFDELYLVRGDELVDRVPTYRGEAANFG